MNIRDFKIAAGAQQTNITQGLLVWLSTGADNNWSTTANWNGNRRPLDGNTLNFGVGSRLYPVNDITSLSLNGIAFTPTASSFAISGNAFTQADGSAITNNSNNVQSIANAIVLATGANAITVNAANANLTLSGSISGGGTLIKTGANTLTLSGTNTYTGNTTVNAGTLAAGSTTAFGNQTKLTVATGAKFDVNGNDVTISGFTSITANGTVTNTGSAAKLTLATGITGNSTTAVIAQLFTGNLSLQLYAANAANTNSILTNGNNTYNGGTTLGLGIANTTTRVILGGGSGFGIGTAGAITRGLFGTGPITVGANPNDLAQIYFNGGSSTFNYDVVANSSRGDIIFSEALRIEASNITFAGTLRAELADIGLLTNNSLGLSATITGAISGNNGLRIITTSIGTNGVGQPFIGGLTVTLNNTNTYNGNTTIGVASASRGNNNATLKLGAENKIPNGAGKGNLIITAGTFNLNGFNETINGLVGSGTIDGMSGTPTLTVGDNNAASTFAGVIKNTAGTLSLVKIGAGTLTLSGTISYTGSTSITDGTLVVTAVTSGITATAAFTPTVLEVTFSSMPTSGQQYQFFKGSTEHEYESVSLNGALGLSGTYDSANSTLTLTTT